MKHTISRNKVIWRFLMFGFTWVLQPFVSVKSMTHHDSPKVSRRCRRWCRLWHQSAAPHAPRHAPPPCGSDRHAWRNPWEIPGVKRQRLSCFAFGGIERDIRITYSHTHIICMYYVYKYIYIYSVCIYIYSVHKYIHIQLYRYIYTYALYILYIYDYICIIPIVDPRSFMTFLSDSDHMNCTFGIELECTFWPTRIRQGGQTSNKNTPPWNQTQ